MRLSFDSLSPVRDDAKTTRKGVLIRDRPPVSAGPACRPRSLVSPSTSQGRQPECSQLSLLSSPVVLASVFSCSRGKSVTGGIHDMPTWMHMLPNAVSANDSMVRARTRSNVDRMLRIAFHAQPDVTMDQSMPLTSWAACTALPWPLSPRGHSPSSYSAQLSSRTASPRGRPSPTMHPPQNR